MTRRFLFLSLLILACVLAQLAVCVHATSVANVPPKEARDLVISSGLYRTFSFPIGGAQIIDAHVSAPEEIAQYITLTDPAPRSGPRSVVVNIAIPSDAKIPPGVYAVTFSAREITTDTSAIATQVAVSVGITLRSYSAEPLLEVTNVDLSPTPIGSSTNATVYVISRTLSRIPNTDAMIYIFDSTGAEVARGTAFGPSIGSGESSALKGTIPTQHLDGGIYRTAVEVRYSGKSAWYNRTILRVGTLTIDVTDYTTSFLFNQTNKMTFTLQSDWNKELTRIATTVRLFNQEKRAPELSLAPFAAASESVYFDRTELPSGQYDGLITVAYQELHENVREQDAQETHVFTIPITVDIVKPVVPAEVEGPSWISTITTAQIIIAVAIVILIGNILLAIVLLRPKRDATPATAASAQAGNAATTARTRTAQTRSTEERPSEAQIRPAPQNEHASAEQAPEERRQPQEDVPRPPGT
jgi:hypothetical protein